MNYNLSLHCEVAWYIWSKLFDILDEKRVCPAYLSAFSLFGHQVYRLWEAKGT